MRIKFGEGARRGGRPPPSLRHCQRPGWGGQSPAGGTRSSNGLARARSYLGSPESITLANYLASEVFSKLLPGTPR